MYLVGGFLPNTVRNLLCIVTAGLNSWNHSMHLAFSTRDAISTTVNVALQMERFGNSSGTNYKLDHITYSNAFSFHSSAFRFTSSVTVKWYTFHVNILYSGSVWVASIRCIYRVSHLTWNPPWPNAAAAASELPGNLLVTTQNTAVAC
jgi:hypothetical protein